MSATIRGCEIEWPAGDTTIVKLEAGIASLYVNLSAVNITVMGSDDASPLVIDGASEKRIDLPDVNGYPNQIRVSSAGNGTIRALIHPSPHINTHYVSDCQKLLSGGYDA